MKQIKTILKPYSELNSYDLEVNRLLREGWELKKRAITTASGEPNEVGSCAVVQVLYAELEKTAKEPYPEEITL